MFNPLLVLHEFYGLTGPASHASLARRAPPSVLQTARRQSAWTRPWAGRPRLLGSPGPGAWSLPWGEGTTGPLRPRPRAPSTWKSARSAPRATVCTAPDCEALARPPACPECAPGFRWPRGRSRSWSAFAAETSPHRGSDRFFLHNPGCGTCPAPPVAGTRAGGRLSLLSRVDPPAPQTPLRAENFVELITSQFSFVGVLGNTEPDLRAHRALQTVTELVGLPATPAMRLRETVSERTTYNLWGSVSTEKLFTLLNALPRHLARCLDFAPSG